MTAEFQPVRAVFRGWREEKGTRKIVTTELDGAFPSINDIGAPGDHRPNPIYSTAKTKYSLMLSALLREPNGSEYHFIKPGTKNVKCIMPVERDGDLPPGAGFMLLEARCVWPDLRTRDQQNYGAIIFKFVPDVLEADGYLAKHDDWFGLQCGNLGRGLNRKTPAYTELFFFPAVDRLVPLDEGADLEAALF